MRTRLHGCRGCAGLAAHPARVDRFPAAGNHDRLDLDAPRRLRKRRHRNGSRGIRRRERLFIHRFERGVIAKIRERYGSLDDVAYAQTRVHRETPEPGKDLFVVFSSCH
jgi:hypothetical protein